MSAIPTRVAAESKAALPLPINGLSEAARRVVDASPGEIIRRWISGLSEGIRRKYSQSCREFCRWAMNQKDAKPEDALRLLVQAGPTNGHQLLVGFRDALLDRGLSTGSAAGMLSGLASLVAAWRRAGITDWRPERVAPKVERRQDRSGPRRFEAEAIVEHVDARAADGDPVAVRDAAILRLLYSRHSSATSCPREPRAPGDTRKQTNDLERGFRARSDSRVRVVHAAQGVVLICQAR